MAQDWARSFYKSHAWLHNRKAYLDSVIDLEGHVLKADDDGSYYWVDEYGLRVTVPPENIVPSRMCERCFRKGRLKPAKVVHHKKHLNPQNISDPHVTLAFANFQRLCQDCHAIVHSKQAESRVTFDESGRVVWDREAR